MKFLISLSFILVIGCTLAIVLLSVKKAIIIDSINSKIQESLDKLPNNDPATLAQHLSDHMEQTIQSFVFELNLMMIGVSVFVLVAVYIIFVFLVRRRLAALMARFRDVTQGDGDLTRRIELKGNDGIDKLGHQFNNLIKKIHDIMLTVVSASNQVSSASSNVSTITQQTADVIIQQRSETDQIATAMNEMTATVQEVTNHANNAANAAQHAQSEAVEGKKTVEQTIDSINSLANEVTQAHTVISQLQADSDSIGSVIEVIQQIAEQTNLLALNAAIEAARAGEQGRGFAVVADEVRTLASRTQQSTEEIKAMIEKLQAGANNAADVMNTGHKRAEDSVNQASQAGAALDSITQAVSTISEMNTHIAHSANEQQSVVSSMDENLTSISHSANSTVEAMQNSQSETTELARLTAELEETLSQFKL